MKHKTNRRKQNKSDNNLILTNTLYDRKCPSCGNLKSKLVHFVHKDVFKNKRILELLLCEDCLIAHKQQIIEKKDKKFFYLVPILNSMLKAIGRFEEKSLEQLESEFEILPEGEINDSRRNNEFEPKL